MKMPTLLSVSLLAALSLPAAAQTAPPQDVPFDGTLKIDVDATDLAHRIFKVNITMPAKPGPMTLLYPQWIPGDHSPTGPIDKLAGLVIKVDGKVVPWKRDQFDVYAFKVDVPQGATELTAEFKFLSPQAGNQGRVMMTPEMLNLQWNTTALYPAGYVVRNIKVQASVTPACWLELCHRAGNRSPRRRHGELQADRFRRPGRFADVRRQVLQARGTEHRQAAGLSQCVRR